MTVQEKLIGKHPEEDFFSIWLDHEDKEATPEKRHRIFSEKTDQRAQAIDQIALWIIKHHLSKEKLLRFKKKREIYEKYKFDNHLKANYPFPKHENTKKGNTGEILLSQYLQNTSGLKPLAYKLHYNPNIDQAIKGDDCLLLNESNLHEKIIVGEAKFLGEPKKQKIDSIILNLEGNKRLPTSIPFVAQHFETAGNSEFAGDLEELLTEVYDNKVPIVNVGFLMSTKSGKPPSKDTCYQVDKYALSKNPRLVFLALGIDEPMQIVQEAFAKADSMLKSVDDLLCEEVYMTDVVTEIENASTIDDLEQEFEEFKTSSHDS